MLSEILWPVGNFEAMVICIHLVNQACGNDTYMIRCVLTSYSLKNILGAAEPIDIVQIPTKVA